MESKFSCGLLNLIFIMEFRFFSDVSKRKMFKPIIIGNFEEFKLYKTLIRVKVSADTGLSAATTRRISLFGSILIYFLEKQAIVKDNCRHI